MAEVGSPETQVSNYETIRRHIPHDRSFHMTYLKPLFFFVRIGDMRVMTFVGDYQKYTWWKHQIFCRISFIPTLLKWFCYIKFDVLMALNTFWSSRLWSLFWQRGPTPRRIALSPSKIQVKVETVYIAEELVTTYQTIRLHDVEGHNTVLIHQDDFGEGITKCSNEVYDKFTDIRQHNKYLLEYLGYMFRPVNRSSSGHQYSESEVLFRYLAWWWPVNRSKHVA